MTQNGKYWLPRSTNHNDTDTSLTKRKHVWTAVAFVNVYLDSVSIHSSHTIDLLHLSFLGNITEAYNSLTREEKETV